MKELQYITRWSRESPELNFKSWLMINLESAEACATELAAQLATAQAEIVRLNQKLAQIVINSVSMP